MYRLHAPVQGAMRASSAVTANSVRMIRRPKLIGVTPFAASKPISYSVNPPSGPTTSVILPDK